MRYPIIILIIVMLSGCRATKDRKAMGRVLANPDLREEVYKIQSGLHPVIPQQPVYLPGKDSLIVIRTPANVDSIIEAERKKINRDCPSVNFDSLKAALTTTIYKIRVDTLLLPDPQTSILYNDLLKDYWQQRGEIIVTNNQNAALNKEIKDNTKWRWIERIGWLLLLTLSIFIIFKKK